MRRNSIFIGLILLFLSVQGFPAQQSQKNLKDADAIFLKINKVYTLKPDGCISFEYSHKVKLLTYYAVNRYLGETFIVYNPKFQKLNINKSETTMVDGTLVPSPENAFNEVLPGFVSRAPAYAYLREMVVTHTGLERGCITDLKYHIDTGAKHLPWLMGEEIFGKRGPIQEMTVTVNVPKGVDLKYHMFNSSIQPLIKEKKEYTQYVWEITDCPVLKSESNHQQFAEFTPRLVFSTSSSWEDIVKYMRNSIEKKCELTEKTRNSLLKEVNELDRFQRMLAIRKIVAEEIGNVRIGLSIIDFHSFSAEKTFLHNYGHTLDKAILLKAILDAEDFESELALVSSHHQFENSMPTLSQFTSACVIVKRGEEKPLILLPERPQKRVGRVELAGRTLLTLESEKPTLIHIPIGDPQENFVCIKADLKMDQNLELQGNVLVKTGGFLLPGFELWKEKDQQRFIQKILDQIFGKTSLEKCTVRSLTSDIGIFSAEVNIKDAFQKIEKTEIFEFSVDRANFLQQIEEKAIDTVKK